MARTNFHDDPENRVDKLFWGKINIEAATAFCYFHKKSNIKDFIHSLKYDGKKEIGYILGRHFAAELLKSKRFKDVDLIIPIPLHPKRQKKRGYNQSEWIAKGIAEIMNKKIDTESVIRNTYNESQTKKGREERWTNVESIFIVPKPENLNNKYIMLVDDVITTGSTIEACVKIIQQTSSAKICIAAIAVAGN